MIAYSQTTMVEMQRKTNEEEYREVGGGECGFRDICALALIVYRVLWL